MCGGHLLSHLPMVHIQRDVLSRLTSRRVRRACWLGARRVAALLAVHMPFGVVSRLACVQGKVRMLAGAKCGYMPLAAPPGRLAFMSLGDAELGLYFAKHPRNYEVGGEGLLPKARAVPGRPGAGAPLCPAPALAVR